MPERHRSRSDHGDRHRDRARGRERSRERDKHKSTATDSGKDRHRNRSRDEDQHRSSKKIDKDQSEKRPRSPQPNEGPTDEAEKKRQRLAKLAAWKSKKDGATEQSSQPVEAITDLKDDVRSSVPQNGDAEANGHHAQGEQEAWLPWEDPAALFTAGLPTGEMNGPPPGVPAPKPLLYEPHEGEDPLDAFMAAEVAPEVKAKEQEEAKRREEARVERAKLMAEGKVPKLDKILEEESDEEELPDQELQIPEHKVKLVVGPGGEKIKYIQRKSKCRLQIKKSDAELNKGFLEKTSYAVPKPRQPGDEVKMVTMMLFGNAKECEIATRMIDEAIENREQKQKQREKEYERKREQKNRDRQMYHLRHTHDYETLEIPIGASKADARKAYRQMAKKYHPDKHPDNREAMKEKFQAIQKAFDSLMSSDEDARIEALSHR